VNLAKSVLLGTKCSPEFSLEIEIARDQRIATSAKPTAWTKGEPAGSSCWGIQRSKQQKADDEFS